MGSGCNTKILDVACTLLCSVCTCILFVVALLVGLLLTVSPFEQLAAKKVSLVDVGVVGDLGDGQNEKDKGPPPTSFYMGRAMGTGSGLGRSGFASSESQALDADFFSSLGSQQYQFGSFKK